MKLYEIAYIADSGISPEEATALQEKITNAVIKNEGSLGVVGVPQKRKLAYEVKKQDYAYFSSFDFSIEEEKIKEIERLLKKESLLLRHLLLKKPTIKEREKRAEKKKSLKPEKAKMEEIDKKIDEII